MNATDTDSFIPDLVAVPKGQGYSIRHNSPRGDDFIGGEWLDVTAEQFDGFCEAAARKGLTVAQ
jgi:hypothetical protein